MDNEVHIKLPTSSSRLNSPSYQKLAHALWCHVIGSNSIKATAQVLGSSEQRIRRWHRQVTPVRTAPLLMLLHKSGVNISHISASVLAPYHQPNITPPYTETILSKRIIAPLLRYLRRDRTLSQVKTILSIDNTVSFHHWEKGERDVPLPILLKCIDLLGGRLQVFCESIGFKQDLQSFGFLRSQPDFSTRLFKLPWTPTVYLALQTDDYRKWSRHSDRALAQQLTLNLDQIQIALSILADLELIRFDGTTYLVRKGAFYAPPSLTPEVLDGLHTFWFSKSVDFYHKPGYHKVEQASVSQESYQKIIGWVSELREKIREEVKTTEPETIIHMHWQVLDLLSKPKITKSEGEYGANC